jgi:hypothetical protein
MAKSKTHERRTDGSCALGIEGFNVLDAGVRGRFLDLSERNGMSRYGHPVKSRIIAIVACANT